MRETLKSDKKNIDVINRNINLTEQLALKIWNFSLRTYFMLLHGVHIWYKGQQFI